MNEEFIPSGLILTVAPYIVRADSYTLKLNLEYLASAKKLCRLRPLLTAEVVNVCLQLNPYTTGELV